MNTIYKDRLIEITDEEVIFHIYYFPFGGDKHVALNQIESVQINQPSFFGGSWRLWGSNGFRTWFPLDYRRPNRDRIFIASLRGQYMRIGFTAEDSQKVADILKERGLLFAV